MRFSETIKIHGVEITVSGTFEPAESATRDYPGSAAEVNATHYNIGGVDVSGLIDACDLYESIDTLILSALGEPILA